jgi:hypothetical protein
MRRGSEGLSGQGETGRGERYTVISSFNEIYGVALSSETIALIFALIEGFQKNRSYPFSQKEADSGGT